MILSKNLTKQLEDISKAMVLVQKGKLDTRVPIDRNDEFGEVAKNFNDMTSELDNFLKSQISQQKRLNEANVAMLQAQLNPHFLYNTLDTIKWVAKANDVPVIATLSTKLAKILRTSISHKKFVTMKEEMDLIVSYMEIQNIRFEHRFNYKISLEDNVSILLVPKLIIQTIVENCLIHGFKGSEKGNILINGYKIEEKLFIEVIDDGIGICGDIVNRINNYNSTSEGHIGLNNVKTIIMLYYGNEYGLVVENTNPGTKVTITIPAERGI
jgi:two-component system sensor histidine kinase YesM